MDQPIAADDFFAGKALPGSPASCAPATVDTNDPGDYFLDLDEALALADADNPTIALAAEAVGASRARQTQARAHWLPTVDAGLSTDLHSGNLQSGEGIIRNLHRESLYAGAGASAVGAGTVTIPGVRLTAHVADAVFDPRIAEQDVAGRRLDAEAARNGVLLAVALQYLELAGAQARLAAIQQTLADLAEVVRLTANFAKTGQGREGDAERARSVALLLTAQAQGAEEEVGVAQADLARLLSIDPAVRLHAALEPLPLLQLIDLDGGLESLVDLAIRNRPEIAARTADISASAATFRRERIRPLLPLLSVGVSAGTFGGGADGTEPRFGRFDGRTDFDALAVWRLDNLGAGNFAVQKRMRAALDEAEAERRRTIDQIQREVVEAFASSMARRQDVNAALKQVEAAQKAYQLDLKRIRNVEGKPIEVLSSVNLLNAARQALIQAIVGYDQAQFQLLVSLGQPPMSLSQCRVYRPLVQVDVQPLILR